MAKNFDKKNLIILGLIILVLVMAVSFWGIVGSWQNFFCLFKKEECILINPQKFIIIKKEESQITSAPLVLENFKEGNSGQVELAINLEKYPPEISWPEDYLLQSIDFQFMNSTQFADDNYAIWGFSFESSKTGLKSPITYGQIPEGVSSSTLTDPFPTTAGRPYFRYLISAEFQKQGGNKIYQGIYGFTY